MADVGLKIVADIAESERKIEKVKQSIKDLGQQERKLAESPLNPSPATRISQLAGSPLNPSPTKRIDELRDSGLAQFKQWNTQKGYIEEARIKMEAAAAGTKQIGAGLVDATTKAQALNAAVGLLPPELQAAASIAGGLSPAFLATASAVGAVGFAVINVTTAMKTEAERRLALEEKIQGAYNRQIFSLKAITAELEKQRALAGQGRIVSDQLKDLVETGNVGGIDDLQKGFETRLNRSLAQVSNLKRSLEIVEANEKSIESRETSGFFGKHSAVMSSLGLIFTEKDKNAELARIRDQARQIKEALALAEQDLQFDKGNVLQADSSRYDAVKQGIENAAKAQVEGVKQAIESAIDGRAGDVNGLRGLRGQIAKLLFDPSEVNRLEQQTSQAISEAYKRLIAKAGNNVGSLRNLGSQILGTEEIKRSERLGLVDGINKQIDEAIEKGKEKVTSLGQAWTGAFNDLFTRTNTNNPFAAFMQRSATEAEKLKEQLRGLPPELQKLAFAMKSVADSRELFKLQLDAQLGALDLRQQAQEFRQGRRDDTNDPKVIQRRLDQQLAILGGAGVGNVVNGPTGKPITSDWFDLINGQWTKRVEPGTSFEETKARQAEADRLLIARTQGVDPSMLRGDQNSALASAREREASRILDAEKEAKKDREEQKTWRNDLKTSIDALLSLAQTGGLDAIVSVIDESDLANTTRQSKPSDTAGRRSRK
jgi:hypothetical protein